MKKILKNVHCYYEKMQCVINTLLYGKNLRKNHYNQKKNSSAVIDNEEISNRNYTINMYNKCGLYLT